MGLWLGTTKTERKELALPTRTASKSTKPHLQPPTLDAACERGRVTATSNTFPMTILDFAQIKFL